VCFQMSLVTRVSLFALVVYCHGSHAPLMEGLAQELVQDFPGESAEVVDRLLTQALEVAAAREELTQDWACLRDYSKLCPQGWSEMQDGHTCLAPAGYQGVCAKMTTFSNLDPTGKSGRASECGTVYPCIGRAPENFSMPCPVDWEVDVDAKCIAPGSYAGPCIGRKSFVGLTPEEKASWGRKCGVAWPARKPLKDLQGLEKVGVHSSGPCLKDYTNQCPVGWLAKGYSCLAPSQYTGLCGPRAHASLTQHQKKVVEVACAVEWPCLSRRNM